MTFDASKAFNVKATAIFRSALRESTSPVPHKGEGIAAVRKALGRMIDPNDIRIIRVDAGAEHYADEWELRVRPLR